MSGELAGELAGALNQRVSILRRSADRDDLGGASGAWDVVMATWAALAPISAASWGAGDRPSATARWRAVLRAGADVAPGDRMQWRVLLLTVRMVEADPATPDRIALTLEEDR